jgi:hypothetical protein
MRIIGDAPQRLDCASYSAIGRRLPKWGTSGSSRHWSSRRSTTSADHKGDVAGIYKRYAMSVRQAPR